MKTAYLVTFSVLVVLMTTVVGAVSSDDTAQTKAAQQSVQADTALLSQLNSAPTFSDSTLRRPF